jgi:hypothetical protein
MKGKAFRALVLGALTVGVAVGAAGCVLVPAPIPGPVIAVPGPPVVVVPGPVPYYRRYGYGRRW